MQTAEPPKTFLTAIVTVFLGLLIAAFVGLGIAAFYPQPEPPENTELFAPVRAPSPGEEFSEKERIRQQEVDQAYKDYRQDSERYHRNAAVASLVFSVLLLIAGILLARSILVIADGIVLGGIFTLLYSIGHSLEGGDVRYQFAIVGIGLAAAIALSYLKFVKPIRSDA